MALSKALAALLVILFVFLALFVILTWSVEASFLDSDAYVQALEGAGFFEVPYQLIREGNIPGAGGLLLTQGPLSVVSGADMEMVARELAPPDWLRAQLERAIRDLVAVAETSELNELPDLVISLSEVKARALGEPGDRALTIVIESLPVCAPDRAPLELESDTPVCMPVNVDSKVFRDRLKTLLAPLVERVPDTYRVSWQPEERDVLEDLKQAGQALDRLKVALLLLSCLNLTLLGLIWLLAVRSPAEWLRWAGIPLLLVGLATLLLAALIPEIIARGLEGTALAAGDVPAPLVESLKGAIRDFSLLLFRPALLIGVALAFPGSLLALMSPLFPHRRSMRSTRW